VVTIEQDLARFDTADAGLERQRIAPARFREMSNRRHDLVRFYAILDRLERRIGGARRLADCSGRLAWPHRGVYFFREVSEMRSETGSGARIVRVGTHALKSGSSTTLWTRLSQHKGQPTTGGGNHRGSIFRLIVGAALAAREGYDFPTWGNGNTAASEVRKYELPLEQEVSRLIGTMPFLWLTLGDDAGPASLRGYIERNAIALLSNYGRAQCDPPSPDWLDSNSSSKRRAVLRDRR
jgi:hypothetical protein